MKIIRYAGLEYKHASEPTHLYHVEREGSHYLLYYKGGGSLSYDAKMTGTPAEVAAAFDKEVEFLGSGAYHNENWQVATETPDQHAQKILGIFEHPTFGIKWEKTGVGQSSEDQFCDMLEQQVKEWKGSAHTLSVARHPYWPKFHAMVRDAVSKEYGSSIRLYRGIRGEQALPILDGVPSKNRGATAWTSDLSSARVYAAGKTKRGDADWVVVRRSFSPEEILLAPVMLDGPCENPDILMRLARDVEHYGDEWIVDLPEFIPGDFKIVAKPRGIKSESLLREYIRTLLVEETIPIGLCFPHAVKLAREASKEEWNDLTKFKVVHGKITDKWSGETVDQHAWVEKGDMIFDWQTSHTKPEGISRDVYYDMYQPEPRDEYTAEETVINCVKEKQMGPW